MLRKKAVALAVAGAIGVPVAAFAQSPNIQIYGKLYPQIGMAKGSGGTASGTAVSNLVDPGALDSAALKNRLNVDPSNSRIGIRGSEDLGGGMKAIFQIENRVALDQGGTFWASRDSYLGLSGGFGTVKLGFMDPVYKSLGDPLGFLGISSGNFVSFNGVLSQGPFDNMSFHERERNTIFYESPEFGGVQLLASYSIPTAEERKTPGSNLKANTTSLGVKYEAGPLYLAAAHEIRKDQFGFSNSDDFGNPGIDNTGTASDGVHSKDTATRGAVSFTFGSATKLAFDIAQLQWKETGTITTGQFGSYKNRRMGAAFEQGFGNMKAAVTYARATEGTCTLVGAPCSSDGLDGNQLNVGGMLTLTKRTSLFAIWSRLTNGKSAAYQNAAAGDVSPGTDITQAAVGINHSF